MSRISRSAPAFTVSADLLGGLIDCALQCGTPRARLADLLEEAAEPSNVAAPKRYSGAYVARFWERLIRETGDSTIGFRMACVAEPRTFGVLGQILPRCATMLEAFRQTIRYSALASDGGELSLEIASDTLTLTLHVRLPPGDVARTVILWGLGNLAVMPTRIAGVSAWPLRAECAFASPPSEALRRMQSPFPFRFDQPRNAVIFDRTVGTLQIPSADSELKALLAEAMDRRLKTLRPDPTFEDAIAAVLRGMVNGAIPTLPALASRAGLSARTLQRRLRERGGGFQPLLRRVLNEVADEHLSRGELTQGEIAFLLGYSEESAFSRAYRSWTGRPPSQARIQG